MIFALVACLITAYAMMPAAQSAPADALTNASNRGSVDAQLRKVIELVQQQRLDTALQEVDRLVARQPNFRLAHLVRGDILLARRQPLAGLGSTDVGHVRLEELRAEARARLRAHVDVSSPDVVPRYLLQFGPSQKHAIVVDAGRSRVYLYANVNGSPRLVAHYYSSIGKQGMDKNIEGDQKTPIGVYNVSSHIPGSKLPDLYGWGAFPINYPNEWDRRLGKTGYGIWLHGVPSTAMPARPAQATAASRSQTRKSKTWRSGCRSVSRQSLSPTKSSG